MTLNQVEQQIKKIVGEQALIRTYYFGEITEWVGFSGLQYTSVLLVLNNARILPSQAAFNFTIYVADLLDAEGMTRTEIQSDTLLILNDIISELDSIAYDWELDYNNNDVTFFDDERGNDTADKVAGVKFDFTIRTKMLRDRCQIPRRKFIHTEQGFTIFTEDGRGVEQEDKQEVTMTNEEYQAQDFTTDNSEAITIQ